MQYGVVMVTATDIQEARAIAQVLLDAKLAACVSIMPIHSIYRWQGEVQQAEECQLLIKTDLAKFEAIQSKVQEVHSYEVPEIIALPILNGSSAYLKWIAEQTQDLD